MADFLKRASLKSGLIIAGFVAVLITLSLQPPPSRSEAAPTPTAVPISSPTSTATATATALPTSTSTPVPTLTPSPTPRPPGEWFLVINVRTNTEYVYRGDPETREGTLVEVNTIASGKHSYVAWQGDWYYAQTPTGRYRILTKEPRDPSGMYGPWFLRLEILETDLPLKEGTDGLGLHGTNKPESLGQWATHGCIRHDNDTIRRLAEILPMGTIVWMVDD